MWHVSFDDAISQSGRADLVAHRAESLEIYGLFAVIVSGAARLVFVTRVRFDPVDRVQRWRRRDA